ncbi:MAG: TolC family protein [Burkholderiaceae bacterium]|jgi:adhesin transport system outer membrane protein
MSNFALSELRFNRKPIIAVMIGLLFTNCLNAQSPMREQSQTTSSVQSVIDRSLQKNPELRARVHALETASATSDVVFGDLLPRVDARGSIGRERSAFDNQPSYSYNANSVGIEAKQLLFNGFSSQAAYYRETSNMRSRFFEVEEAANNIGLDVARAYFNVARFKILVTLAEENYQRHQTTLAQIQKKVEAGVGRRSDLDQTIGRISLALSNITTERNNLFAALAQYQRLTGEAWPENDNGMIDLDTPLNTDQAASLKQAFDNHPAIRGASARLEASSADVQVASGGFFPRFDLRARADRYSNYLATQQSRNISAIEVLGQVNLYRGGSDMAQQKVASARRSQLLDDRIRICNNVRQGIQAAIYDAMSSDRKIAYLQNHQASIAKAREAYIQQFDVGQRNLLDLLDAENELYQSQRAVINGRADRSIARMTLLANQGILLEAMRITTLQNVTLPEKRTAFLGPSNMASGADNSEGQCPSDLLQVAEIALPDPADFSVLSQPGKPSGLLSAPSTMTSLSNGAGGRDDTDGKSLEKSTDDVRRSTEQWARAWSNRDVDAYIAMYSDRFRPEAASLSAWKAQRRNRVGKAKNIDVSVSDLQVIPSFDSKNEIEVQFVQKYRSDSHRETSNKTLVWAQERGSWKIIRESNSASLPSSAKSNKTSDSARKTLRENDPALNQM